MKPLLITLGILTCFIWALSLGFFISTDFQALHPEEQQRIKIGKSFWEWPSPYGTLAVHFLEKGEGSDHILLIHGFRSHTYTWKELIDPLAQAGYHVWALDLIGYGLSDKPDDTPYTFDFFMEQIDAFMEAKGMTQATLVGSSMGGGLALNMAFVYPQRIQSLILISALGYPLDMPFYISIARHISQVWTPFLGPTSVRNSLKNVVFNEKDVTEEQVMAYCMPYQFQGGIMSTLLTLRQYDNQRFIDIGQNYSKLRFPISIIWGEHDTVLPIDHYDNFLKDFPHAYQLLIKECGHIPQEEKPQEVLTAMLDFLERVSYK